MAGFALMCCTLFLVGTVSAQTSNIPSESVLASFLEVWKSGTNELLPPLSPIPIGDLNTITYHVPTISVSFSANSISLIGLNSFVTNSIVVSETESVNLKLNVPNAVIHADAYVLKGRAVLIPINCKGALDITLRNVDLTADFRLAYNETSVWVDYADVQFSPTQDAQVKMASCSSVITGIVSTEVNKMLKEGDSINQLLRDELVSAADNLLATTTIADLNAFIYAVVETAQ